MTGAQMAVAQPPSQTDLPSLVDRASQTLASARSYAEVLEARDMASLAYDAARSADRIMRAKGAHDELIAKVHRAQADALEIEAQAKRRLADEYDAAQVRGEVARLGSNQTEVGVPDGNTLPTASDLGLTRKGIHEARQIRDAEESDPGIVKRTIEEKLVQGQAPTKADVRRAVAKPNTDTPTRKPSGLSSLTREALEEEVTGLREENDVLRDQVALIRRERTDFETRWKEATADNQGAVIGKLQKQVQAANYARDEALAATKRMEYLAKKAEKRVAELENTPVEMPV